MKVINLSRICAKKVVTYLSIFSTGGSNAVWIYTWHPIGVIIRPIRDSIERDVLDYKIRSLHDYNL